MITPRIAEVTLEETTSPWLKKALYEALCRDPQNAAWDAALLLDILIARAKIHAEQNAPEQKKRPPA